ncbi:MAG TPA: hypothetical protein VFQ23_11400 [Anaerolineales bacterium]|nr:hypothetical protein [Anaerolineales bacterium]
MERRFYPAAERFFHRRYIQPAISFLITGFIIEIFYLFRGLQPTGFILGNFLGVWFLNIVIITLTEGFRGEMLAIKVTPDSIYGPIRVGRDMPIPFNEIDFEKTRKMKGIHSIHGDEIRFETALFSSNDVAETWTIIDKFEQKHRNL